VREMSISENYERNITPHSLRYFSIFERRSMKSPGVRSHISLASTSDMAYK
jgi:hypothetical protein